jgi:hypothetical protein
LMTSESKFKTFSIFMDWDYYLYWVEFLENLVVKTKSSRNRAFFIKVWFVNRIELKS